MALNKLMEGYEYDIFKSEISFDTCLHSKELSQTLSDELLLVNNEYYKSIMSKNIITHE